MRYMRHHWFIIVFYFIENDAMVLKSLKLFMRLTMIAGLILYSVLAGITIHYSRALLYILLNSPSLVGHFVLNKIIN